jgi:hypothetical protein
MAMILWLKIPADYNIFTLNKRHDNSFITLGQLISAGALQMHFLSIMCKSCSFQEADKEKVVQFCREMP